MGRNRIARRDAERKVRGRYLFSLLLKLVEVVVLLHRALEHAIGLQGQRLVMMHVPEGNSGGIGEKNK